MAMNAVACIGRDGGGVSVEVSLGETEGGVGRWRGDGGDGGEDGVRKGGSDGSCGEGRRFLHSSKEKLSTSIDELEKSGRNVLKPMKLISYETD